MWRMSRSGRPPEAARSERREVIANNRASAEAVRREWLRTFLAHKTAPKGTAVFLAAPTAHVAETIADIGGNHLAADLLGGRYEAGTNQPTCDNTGELLVVMLREGNAGSNTGADHVTVLSAAIAPIPSAHRRDLLVTNDGAGIGHATSTTSPR